MFLEEKDDVILIRFENQIEKQILERIINNNNQLIFQLQKDKEGICLTKLGQANHVCNVPINVLYSNEDFSVKLISNLAHTPFRLNDKKYESVEGFWQSLKFQQENDKNEIAKLHGKEAKKTGSRQNYHKNIYFERKRIKTGSSEHWNLMEKACRAKFSQHIEAQQALVNTGNRPLYHRPSKDSTTIPGAIMAEIWMKIREELLND
ncbi:MAG: NADAR family protein [Chitinophagales bacterium]